MQIIPAIPRTYMGIQILNRHRRQTLRRGESMTPACIGIAQHHHPLRHLDSHAPCGVRGEQGFYEVFPDRWCRKQSPYAKLLNPRIARVLTRERIETRQVTVDFEAAPQSASQFLNLTGCERIN